MTTESKEMISKLNKIMGNEVDSEEDDQDYGIIFLKTLESLIKGSRYIKQKKELGDQMLLKEKDFLEVSSLLEDPPIRVIPCPIPASGIFKRTHRVTTIFIRVIPPFILHSVQI